MKLVENGGFLVTSSCTNLVTPQQFLQTIEIAAKDAKKRIRQVLFQTQTNDHPIIRGMENTEYLKFLIIEVRDR
jgi:23S rRNA (cytosine1962-C5)-methyltransferase